MSSVLFLCILLLALLHSDAWNRLSKFSSYRSQQRKLSSSDCKRGSEKEVDSSLKAFRKYAATASLTFGLVFPSVCSPALAAEKGQVLNEVWKIVNDNFFDDRYNDVDWEAIKTDYAKRVADGANEGKLVRKMVSLLGDKYTRILDKEDYENLWKFDAIGVGALFQSDPGKRMYVAAPPLEGSAAAKAGIKKGDLIYSINGESSDAISAMNMLDKLSNDESDTLELEFDSPENVASAAASDESVPIKHKKAVLKRSREKAENPVTFNSFRMPDGKLAGYIKLREFNAESVPAMKEALTALNKEGIEELALDLRGNTGGGFQFALNIGGMFMDNKEMVVAAGRGSDKQSFRSSYSGGVLYRKPLVMITDGLSASSSEVLAAGLRDNCRAVVAGGKTFGKGKIQAVFGLSDGEGLTMTVAQYLTPKGFTIQSRGITPDIPLEVTNPYVNMFLGSFIKGPGLEAINFEEAEDIIENKCTESYNDRKIEHVSTII